MYGPAKRDELSHELTDAFLAGPWTVEMIAESGAGRLDRWPRWMGALAMCVAAVHRTPPVNRPDELFRLITAFLDELTDAEGEAEAPRIVRLTVAQPADRDDHARRVAHGWPIAEIGSVPELAQRLELSDGQLAWLADVRSLERTVASEQLRNYRYRTIPRNSGLPRVIEAPKARLKEIQRWVLREILDHVPPHDAAHGFRAGRSAITHAQMHVGQAAVLRLDLKDFFASVSVGRVYGTFRAFAYSPPVCHVLTGLTTNTVPAAVWQVIAGRTAPDAVQPRFWLGRQLATPHLPQGAPTSPALANLAAVGLDRRLAGLASASGLRYSRYADDLTFSGPARLHRRRAGFVSVVTAIIAAEGFTLNEAKSTLQSAAGRQTVCGVVVNAHPNVRRTEYDRLKAILHNAAVHGPAVQNRGGHAEFQAHLRGRIAWVHSVNPARARKLHAMFDQIDWG